MPAWCLCVRREGEARPQHARHHAAGKSGHAVILRVFYLPSPTSGSRKIRRKKWRMARRVGGQHLLDAYISPSRPRPQSPYSLIGWSCYFFSPLEELRGLAPPLISRCARLNKPGFIGPVSRKRRIRALIHSNGKNTKIIIAARRTTMWPNPNFPSATNPHEPIKKRDKSYTEHINAIFKQRSEDSIRIQLINTENTRYTDTQIIMVLKIISACSSYNNSPAFALHTKRM